MAENTAVLKSNTGGRIAWKVIAYALLTIFAFFMVFPFYFMIATSLVDNELFTTSSTIIVFPTSQYFTLDNYVSVFTISMDPTANSGFLIFFTNTLVVALASTAVTVVTTLLAAFAFARLNFKGKDLLFMVILATMMVPGEMMVLTNYKSATTFGFQNTFSALILVHGVAVFYIFYLRQTFQQIPNELYLASKVDGYSDFQYFTKVMAPLASPTIITIVILSVMGAWNSMIWPELIAPGDHPVLRNFGVNWNMRLVTNGIMNIFATQFRDNVPGRLAGSLVTSIPLFIMFALFRKKIMTGVSRAGIKG